MKITKRQLRKIIREEYKQVLKESMHMQSSSILDEYDLQSFYAWIDDGNAVELNDGSWVEQTTQYRKKFTLEELQMFFKKEYLQ